MSQKGRMMIVQNIYGMGADYKIRRGGKKRKAHTMMRIDGRAAELRAYFEPVEIELDGASDADLAAAVDKALQGCDGGWKVHASSTVMEPGSCIHPQWPTWKPCEEVDSAGGTTTGRVFVLCRQDNPSDSEEVVRVESEFEKGGSKRVFTTEYCAFVQYSA